MVSFQCVVYVCGEANSYVPRCSGALLLVFRDEIMHQRKRRGCFADSCVFKCITRVNGTFTLKIPLFPWILKMVNLFDACLAMTNAFANFPVFPTNRQCSQYLHLFCNLCSVLDFLFLCGQNTTAVYQS